MFTVGRMELFKRLTLIAEDGRIKRVFYPVFSPDRNADDVLACLRSGAQQQTMYPCGKHAERRVGAPSLQEN